MLRRSKYQEATEDVKVDVEILRSKQALQFATPQVYCVVCGRFDREMVKRKNGYKCVECVGTKSQAILRTRQLEGFNRSITGIVSNTAH